MISNLPEPAMETGMTVETGIVVIYDENLEVANVQSNDDFTILSCTDTISENTPRRHGG